MSTKKLTDTREAEEVLIGAGLVDPDVFLVWVPRLSASAFLVEKHRIIWETLQSLRQQNIPLYFQWLVNELDKTCKLPAIGGTAYLIALISNVPNRDPSEWNSLIHLCVEACFHNVEGSSLARSPIEGK